ncbi:unnamed protein product [Cuscuta europaea]|uniref:Uncharacterized protein n=1 Tax=Cuscuta europaea TaxID=41803 RepID=A0A9P1EBJ7_CUSEU|nr:unnamed protein product [Cuscuta europaea]
MAWTSYRPLGHTSRSLYLMTRTSYYGRPLDLSLSHLYLMTRTTYHAELLTSRDWSRPSPQETDTVAAPHLGRRAQPFCFILGASGVLFSPSLGFFPTGFFLNDVFNEASPHCGSKGVSPRPPVEDITRHALLYSSSPHYIHLKEWGTGRAGDLAPPLTKEAEIQKFSRSLLIR